MGNSLSGMSERLSDYGVESKINAIRYDGNEFMKLASSELMSNRGYSLIRGEMLGKVDPNGEKVTQEKIDKYFEGLGGDDFAKDVFQKGKESLLKDAKEVNDDPETYWKKYAKAYDKNHRSLTAEEDKEDNKITAILFNKKLTSLGELPLKDAIANGIFPKFDAKAATLRGLKIWETQDKKVRIKALKKSAATSGAVSRRTTLQERVAKHDKLLHKAEYALGSGEMSPEASSTTPKLDTTLKYRATGSASIATWNSESVRSESEWRGRWQKRAKQYNDLYFRGRLYNEFPGAIRDSDRVLGVMDAITRLEIGAKSTPAFNAKDFKTELDKKFGKDIIYGSYGVFNMLLALERADEEVSKRSGETKILYNLKIGRGRGKQHRFSRLDTNALKKGEVKDANDQKDVKKVGIPLQGPANQQESIKVALIDSFEQGFDKLTPDIQKRTGVSLSKTAGKMIGGIKFVDYFGKYKEKNEKLIRMIAWEGKLRIGGKHYATVQEALVATQAEVSQKAEKFKSRQDIQSAMEEAERKLATREKWITDFDSFTENNKNDLIPAMITITKELGNTFGFGFPPAQKTYDYKITVGSNNIFFVIPEPEARKMDLWARVVNKEVKTTMRSIAKIDIDLKNPKKFITDILAANEKLKAMEKDKEQNPTVGLPKAPTIAVPKEGKPAPEDKLVQKKPQPALVTPATSAKPAPVAVEKPKAFSEAFSAEKPKDMKVAVQQLQDIYDALDKLFPKKGQKEDGVWGSIITPGQANSNFKLTVKGKTYPISVKLSESNEIEFVIGGKDTYSTRSTQKELAKYLETILSKK